MAEAGLGLFHYMTPITGLAARTERCVKGGMVGGGRTHPALSLSSLSFFSSRSRSRSFTLHFFSTTTTTTTKKKKRSYTAAGHDLHSLLFAFLDELLFGFATDGFACAALEVTALTRGGGGSGGGGGEGGAGSPWSLTAVGRGEAFDRDRHAAGTEVKAITYSAMRVDEDQGAGGPAQVWVIVDI